MGKKRVRNDGNNTLDKQKFWKREGSRTRRAPDHLAAYETTLHQAHDETLALPAAAGFYYSSRDITN
jgi:hypothetical protein